MHQPTSSKMTEATRRLWTVFGIFCILCSVFWHFRSNNLILNFDSERLFSPYFSLLADYTRAGQLMLWNPWSNCGAPDGAYVELGAFSPITIAIAAISGGGDTGFLWYWLTIWGGGAAGFFVLARHEGTPTNHAIVVTIAFMFCGFYLGQASFTSWIYSFSFLPWILWRVSTGIERRQVSAAVQAGALYGLSGLAGHPALVIINGLFIAAWTLGQCCFRNANADGAPSVTSPESSPNSNEPEVTKDQSTVHKIKRTVGYLVVLLLIGIVVLSPAYVAFYSESQGYSERSGYLPRDVAIGQYALPPSAILTLTSPFVVFTEYFDGLNERIETFPGLLTMYIGAIVPAFAICSLIHGWKNPWNWWIAFLAAFALACAVGPELPVRGLLYDLCPPTRFFRHSAVFRGYALFCVAMLALRSGTELNDNPLAAWRRLRFVSAALFVVAAGAYLSVATRSTAPGIVQITSHFHFVAAWLTLPVLSFAIAHFGKSAANGDDDSRRILNNFGPVLLVLLALLDARLAFAQTQPLFGGPANVIRQPELQPPSHSISLNEIGFDRRKKPAGAFIDNQNLYTKTPLLENFSTLNNSIHSRASLGSADFSVLETSWCEEPILAKAVVEHRVWFSATAAEVPQDAAAFEAFALRTNQLQAMPLVIDNNVEAGDSDSERKSTDRTTAISSAEACKPIEVKLLEYNTQHASFDVQCDADGWLLFADRWTRGWQAAVNDSPTKVRVGNFLFRAIPVVKGPNHVEFRYRLAGQPWLVILSWMTMCSVFCHAGIRWMRRKRLPEV